LISTWFMSIGDPMSVNTTSSPQPSIPTSAPALTAHQAWEAWVMTPRNTDAELDRWREYYALAVPRPELEAGQ
jgi:hypothetical protein